MAILNVTPDSYVDGGKWTSEELIIARAGECVEQGADIIDIGGESSGPGSSDVSADEELKRVIPAIKAIRKALPDVWISVDTYKASVASAVLEAGADIINDITAGRGDAQMFLVIAKAGCPYIMMFAKDDSARTTKNDVQYDDVIAHIRSFLTSRIDAAVTAGIDRASIIIDPGLGHFVSSDPRYSFQILARLKELSDLGPILVSPSRKSFLAGTSNLPVSDRLPGTIAASIIAVQNGASIIRTHDVGEMRRAIEVWERIRENMK